MTITRKWTTVWGAGCCRACGAPGFDPKTLHSRDSKFRVCELVIGDSSGRETSLSFCPNCLVELRTVLTEEPR